jgi:AP-1 complex subunit gamma-1
MIIECLKENDISIKKQALLVLQFITNTENVRGIAKDLINFMLDCEKDFIQELTQQTCLIIEKFAPSRRWHIDTILRVLTLAGSHVKDESICSLAHLILATPELQKYAVFKIYFTLKENMGQDGLARISLWCIGEFGRILIQPGGHPVTVTKNDILDTIDAVMSHQNTSDTTKEYALTSLAKLFSVFKSDHERISSLIKKMSNHMCIEVQQRACEYLTLLNGDWDMYRESIFEPMPVANTALVYIKE